MDETKSEDWQDNGDNKARLDRLDLDDHLLNIRRGGRGLRLGRTDMGSRAQRREAERNARLRIKRAAKREKT